MKKKLSVLLCLVMILSLCACGSSRSAEASVSEKSYGEAMQYDSIAPIPAPMAVPVQSNGFSDAVGGFSMAAGAAPYAERTEEAASESESPEERPDKIIYSADATVETTDFDTTVGKIDELVEAYGGWIESSSVTGANYNDIARGRVSTRSAFYTLRIPSDSFSSVMEGLSVLGNVPYSSIYTDNISAQYYDAQARLASLQTQETSLNRLMEKAESVEDIIIIEDKLTDVRYDIESIQSKLKNWDRKLSYSTVNLSVSEVEVYTPPTVVNPGFFERLGMALSDGFRSVGRFFTEALLVLTEALPALLLLAVLIAVVVMILRKRKNKAGKTKEE